MTVPITVTLICFDGFTLSLLSTNSGLETPKLNFTLKGQLFAFGLDVQSFWRFTSHDFNRFGINLLGLFTRQNGLIARGD